MHLVTANKQHFYYFIHAQSNSLLRANIAKVAKLARAHRKSLSSTVSRNSILSKQLHRKLWRRVKKRTGSISILFLNMESDASILQFLYVSVWVSLSGEYLNESCKCELQSVCHTIYCKINVEKFPVLSYLLLDYKNTVQCKGNFYISYLQLFFHIICTVKKTS